MVLDYPEVALSGSVRSSSRKDYVTCHRLTAMVFRRPISAAD